MSGGRARQKVFDWAALAARAPDSIRSEFAGFRARHEAFRASMNAYSEKPEAINWNHYRRNISKANLVEDFKKQFEAFTVPLPKDTGTAKIEEQMKKIEVDVKEAIAEAKRNVAVLQETLDKIDGEKPLKKMTITEYLEDKPELKKKADEASKNENWHLGPWS